MKSRVRRKVAFAAVAVTSIGATFLIGGASAVSAATNSGTVALSASRPAFLAHATDLGPAAANQAVDFEILLAYPHESSVAAEAQAVSSPGNPLYRHFLTTAQFEARYSPSPAAVASVESWARGAGLSVASVATSRLYVEVKGSMRQAEKLVGTRLDTYRYQGKKVIEPISEYRVPNKLAATVAGIVDLDTSASLAKPADTLPGPPPGVRYGVQPCSAYYGQKMATTMPKAYGQKWPYTICGYGAKQYESAFGLSSSIAKGLDGASVTVAIVDAYASPTILSDADECSTQNGIAPFATGQFTQDTPPPDGYNLEAECDPQGWYGEETLDVEVRALHGPRSERHVRRGEELRQRPEPGMGVRHSTITSPASRPTHGCSAPRISFRAVTSQLLQRVPPRGGEHRRDGAVLLRGQWGPGRHDLREVRQLPGVGSLGHRRRRHQHRDRCDRAHRVPERMVELLLPAQRPRVGAGSSW